MSEVKHTPRLVIGSKVKCAIYTDMDEPVCIVDSMRERHDDAEIARRLVACWNACNGFNIETLELSSGGKAPSLQEIFREHGDLWKKRDELLDALNKSKDVLEWVDVMYPHKSVHDALIIVRAATACATESAS